MGVWLGIVVLLGRPLFIIQSGPNQNNRVAADPRHTPCPSSRAFRLLKKPPSLPGGSSVLITPIEKSVFL